MSSLLNKICLIVPILLVLIGLSCSKYTELNSTSNDNYVVTARVKNSDVTTPVSLEIFFNTLQSSTSEVLLLREMSIHKNATLKLTDDNILIVKTYSAEESLNKYYFIVNLDGFSSPFELWKNDKWETDKVLYQKLSDSLLFQVSSIKEYENIKHIKILKAKDVSFDLFVFDSQDIKYDMYEHPRIGFSISWNKLDRFTFTFNVNSNQLLHVNN